ncbi:chain-length determining protein [Gammaproteobacteria bacterium 45_16_T64]|nr:chain-length determining protein [Gammaproteobacteria bacterium 45_16_T64]
MKSLSYRFHLIFSGIWRRRYVIVIPIFTLPFMGLLVGISSPKQYASHTSMLIQETAKMNPFLEDFAVSSMLKERMEALNTLLHSRHILGAVAEEMKLTKDSNSPAENDQIISKLSNSLTVVLKGKDLIRIDYKTDSPLKMKETLESISNQFIEQLLAPERSSMTDSSNFLREHLEHRRAELDASEQSLADFKNKNATELPELHVGNIARLTKLKQRLSERTSELAGAKKSLGGLDQQLSKTNPVVGIIEDNIVQIRSSLALLRARYTDGHSKIKGALRNLKRLEEERQHILSLSEKTIDTNKLWDIASVVSIHNDKNQPLLVSQLENLQSARGKVIGLQEEVKSLSSIIEGLEIKAKLYGEQEKNLSQLQRDLKVKRDLYDELLHRYEMARVTGSLGVFEQEKRIKIIDRPYTPGYPSNFPLFIFVISGVFAGVILGFGLALLFELTDTTLRTRFQIEELLNIPVLSRIPPLPEKNGSPL